jgi:hypothetical protein
MTLKVNGGPVKGLFVEQEIGFITVTFGASIIVTATYSAFNVPNGVLDLAVRHIESLGCTVLGMSDIYSSGTKVDVMVGYAYGAALGPTAPSDGTASTLQLFSDTYTSANAQNRSSTPYVAATLSTTGIATFAKFQALPAAVAADFVLGADGKYRIATDYPLN